MLSFLFSTTGGLSSLASIFTLILIFILIIFLAYYTTKFIAKYQSNTINSRSDIRIVESCRLGVNKFIAIVKIGDSYYALGLGKDEITLIDRLNCDEIKFDKTNENNELKKVDFKEILSQIRKKESKENDDK